MCCHNLSFVITLNYVVLSLILGIQLSYLPSANPFTLLSTLAKIGPETLLITIPSLLESLSSVRAFSNLTLHSVISCGEPLTINTAKKVLFSSNHFYNFYGATEFCTWIFSIKVTPEILSSSLSHTVPIGSPLPLVDIVIGQQGELGVSCDHIATTYVYPFFEKVPLHTFEHELRQYVTTGDRIRRISDESTSFYECIGRMDSRIKLKGIFYDLHDIESCITTACPSLRFHISPRVGFFIVFFESKPSDNVSYEIETRISQQLYTLYTTSIPFTAIQQNCLRLNRSGKVDRSYYLSFKEL